MTETGINQLEFDAWKKEISDDFYLRNFHAFPLLFHEKVMGSPHFPSIGNWSFDQYVRLTEERHKSALTDRARIEKSQNQKIESQNQKIVQLQQSVDSLKEQVGSLVQLLTKRFLPSSDNVNTAPSNKRPRMGDPDVIDDREAHGDENCDEVCMIFYLKSLY